jgi:hypothetical protein
LIYEGLEVQTLKGSVVEKPAEFSSLAKCLPIKPFSGTLNKMLRDVLPWARDNGMGSILVIFCQRERKLRTP